MFSKRYRIQKGAAILVYKDLKSDTPFKTIMKNYRGPFSTYRTAVKTFNPKTIINLKKGNFIVKTAQTRGEFEDVLKLRYEIFHREFLNKKYPFGTDMDRFDRLADHLIIVDHHVDKVVGTYRLISSNHSHTFYCQSEFHMDGFMKVPGVKLELSRACIHKDYRTGVVMNLLWRGVSQYLAATGAEFLFGMASIRTMDSREVSHIFKYLTEIGHIAMSYGIMPTESHQFPGFITPDMISKVEHDAIGETAFKALIPPLFNSYLKMGAKVCSLPALDRDFKMADFFTILKISDLTKLYERKYSST